MESVCTGHSVKTNTEQENHIKTLSDSSGNPWLAQQC